jgi:site-specific DNA-methyltransferase (adenine-specific)
MANKLFYGDNLVVLRDKIAPESVDLIYLDPPFNSDATYNVLFKAPSGEPAEAQAEAFVDTWHWGPEAEESFDEVMASGSPAAGILKALRSFLRENDMMAYLANMAARLLEMHAVLKSSGTLYLHCDPNASHYLKILLDGIFGAQNFRNEVIWKRTSAHSSAKRCGPVHDVLLYYTKSDHYCWNAIYQPYDSDYVNNFYTHRDASGRRWRRSDLTGAGVRHGETGKPWRGIDITAKGRHWAYPPSELDKMDAKGRIHWPKKAGGMPMLKRYLDRQPGLPLQDVWTDIRPMHNLSAERLGYPTQKPLSLLERIITASSNEGDIVLDPFCGCGTTVHAAQLLARQWIGIDITHYAVTLVENRLRAAFPKLTIEVDGRPRDLAGARDLAERNPFQFQWWATWLLGAHANREGKRGGDRGVDGLYFFRNGPMGTGVVVISVKSGENLNPGMVRDLAGVVDSEGADLGVLLTLNEPTRGMVSAAVTPGLVRTAHGKFPKVQIVTVGSLLAGRKPDLPPPYVVHNRDELRRTRGHARKVAETDTQLSFTFPFAGGKKGRRAATIESGLALDGFKEVEDG